MFAARRGPCTCAQPGSSRPATTASEASDATTFVTGAIHIVRPAPVVLCRQLDRYFNSPTWRFLSFTSPRCSRKKPASRSSIWQLAVRNAACDHGSRRDRTKHMNEFRRRPGSHILDRVAQPSSLRASVSMRTPLRSGTIHSPRGTDVSISTPRNSMCWVGTYTDFLTDSSKP